MFLTCSRSSLLWTQHASEKRVSMFWSSIWGYLRGSDDSTEGEAKNIKETFINSAVFSRWKGRRGRPFPWGLEYRCLMSTSSSDFICCPLCLFVGRITLEKTWARSTASLEGEDGSFLSLLVDWGNKLIWNRWGLVEIDNQNYIIMTRRHWSPSSPGPRWAGGKRGQRQDIPKEIFLALWSPHNSSSWTANESGTFFDIWLSWGVTPDWWWCMCSGSLFKLWVLMIPSSDGWAQLLKNEL